MRTADCLPLIHVRAMIDELIVLALVVRGTVCIPDDSVMQLTMGVRSSPFSQRL